MVFFHVSVEQSYRDFSADLYPDTFSGVPTVTCAQWLNGETKAVSCVFSDDHARAIHLHVKLLLMLFMVELI